MAAKREAEDKASNKVNIKSPESDLSDARARWREKMKAFKNPVRESERLTADDYAIRINAKG